MFSIPTTKGNSGYRSSPRANPVAAPSPAKVSKMDCAPPSPAVSPLVSFKVFFLMKTHSLFIYIFILNIFICILYIIYSKAASPKESEMEVSSPVKEEAAVKTPKTFYGLSSVARKTPQLAETPAPKEKSPSNEASSSEETPKTTKTSESKIVSPPKEAETTQKSTVSPPPSKSIKRKSSISPPTAAKKLKVASPATKTPKTFYGSNTAAKKTPVLAKTPVAVKPAGKTPAVKAEKETSAIKSKKTPVVKSDVKTPAAKSGKTPRNTVRVVSTKGRTPKVSCNWECNEILYLV